MIKMKKIIETLSKNIDYISDDVYDDKIIINVISNVKNVKCPYCGEASSSINTRYYREIQDLPYKGKPVFIKIRHRIYDCLNENCEQTRFGEPYDFVGSKESKTNRLIDYIIKESEGLTLRQAEKKLRDEGIKVSRMTINRHS